VNAILYPSIFNDVIGPVMRGPSSSHCAGALRIGRMVRDFMNGSMDAVRVRFDPEGSLATTHTSQGSDMGLFAGLLGWDPADERLPQSADAIAAAGIGIQIEIRDIQAVHPNTYSIIVSKGGTAYEITAVSTGGGMVEITAVDGCACSISGDYDETLVCVSKDKARVLADIQSQAGMGQVLDLEGPWIEIKSTAPVPEMILTSLIHDKRVKSVHSIAPVLPVRSYPDMAVPFITCAQMLQSNDDEHLNRHAVEYESARGRLTPAEVMEKMKAIVTILDQSVAQGLKGTSYKDRILSQQSNLFSRAEKRGELLDAGMLNRMILYISALMEMKSSMGLIVAAPTAGSCAGLPGAVLGAADCMGLGTEEKAKAMLAAGMIGIFISAHATFAAEVGGCQAECGAGSGMAAAALATMKGGTAVQAARAASMALQNSFGMTCDPVANRVEVPCLGKNVMAAANALACANMALAGYDDVIPLDEVIEAMHKVGQSLPRELRCTALGGLSVTPASRNIEQKLKGPAGNDL